MGRGSSTDQVRTSLAAVRVRDGDVRGTALEDLLSLSLSPKQETALKALGLLMAEAPDAPGFESYDISEAGARVSSSSGYALGYNHAGAIARSLQGKGLAEKTAGVLKGASGEVSDDEPGWRLTSAGLELAGTLLAGA